MATLAIGEFKLVQAQMDALAPLLNRAMSGETSLRSKTKFEAEAVKALHLAGVPIAIDSVLTLSATHSKPEHLLEEVESALTQNPATIQFHGYDDKDLVEPVNKVMAAGVRVHIVDSWSSCSPTVKP